MELGLSTNDFTRITEPTNTAFPLVYTIFSLLALSLVEVPRVVVGFAAKTDVLLADIVPNFLINSAKVECSREGNTTVIQK